MVLVWWWSVAGGQTPGPSSCNNHDDFERLVEHVATNCCDQFDQVLLQPRNLRLALLLGLGLLNLILRLVITIEHHVAALPRAQCSTLSGWCTRVQDANCDAGTVLVCDTRCAPIYVEFWAACSTYITTNLPSLALRQQFVSTQSKCHATLQVERRSLSLPLLAVSPSKA